jgi:hypothetical protein
MRRKIITISNFHYVCQNQVRLVKLRDDYLEQVANAIQAKSPNVLIRIYLWKVGIYKWLFTCSNLRPITILHFRPSRNVDSLYSSVFSSINQCFLHCLVMWLRRNPDEGILILCNLHKNGMSVCLKMHVVDALITSLQGNGGPGM